MAGRVAAFGWNFLAAFTARAIRDARPGAPRHVGEEIGLGIELGVLPPASKGGGFTLHGPDKTIDYSKTPPSAATRSRSGRFRAPSG